MCKNKLDKPNKLNKLEKYTKMITKIEQLKIKINKLNYQYKLEKEIIDEFETNNLEYLNEMNQIKIKYNCP